MHQTHYCTATLLSIMLYLATGPLHMLLPSPGTFFLPSNAPSAYLLFQCFSIRGHLVISRDFLAVTTGGGGAPSSGKRPEMLPNILQSLAGDQRIIWSLKCPQVLQWKIPALYSSYGCQLPWEFFAGALAAGWGVAPFSV